MAIPNGLAEMVVDVDSSVVLQHQLPLRLQLSNSNMASEVAVVASNRSPIQSLDYEIIENDLSMHDSRIGGAFKIFQYIFMKWMLCLVIGLSVGLVGFFINFAIQNIAGFKFVAISKNMLARRFVVAFIVFASSNLALTFLASLITAFIGPEAAGSGIPEVKAYLNGVDVPSIFSSRTLLVKIVGNILAVSSSLNIGKAGPMVHTGACIAAIVGEGGPKKFRLNWKWLQVLKNDRDRRDLITCGSAAGLAAAFFAPIGGVLFALQQMASWWRTSLLWRTLFTTAIVAMVLRALVDICLGDRCGLFGKQGFIMYDIISADVSYQLGDVPPVLILAIIGGMLGSLHNLLLIKMLKFYRVFYMKGIVHKLVVSCSMSIFTSCLLFGLPWITSCHPCPSDASEPCPTIGRSGNYEKFNCPPGHYNNLASLFFNTNDDAVRNLFNKDAKFHFSSVLLFFSSSFFLSTIDYGVAAPAGLFVPVIVIGASYGRLMGMLVGSSSNLNHGLFAVLGSASLLGGSMRMTFSLCALILELNNDLVLLPLILLVALVSKAVGDVFEESIYDLIIRFKSLPYLEAHAQPYMRQLTVGDMITGPLKIFHSVEKIEHIVHVLRTTGHNGFPVMDEPPLSSSPVLLGLVLRSHIITLLKKKSFLNTPSPDSPVQFSADDFAKKGDRIEDIELSEEEKGMFVNLHPITNTSPYSVVETMSLAKAHKLFREVGLRHLLVIPNVAGRVPVVSILTRHDFMPKHILKLHPRLLRRCRWRRLRFRFLSLN